MKNWIIFFSDSVSDYATYPAYSFSIQDGCLVLVDTVNTPIRAWSKGAWFSIRPA